jgi:hypothetical protein
MASWRLTAMARRSASRNQAAILAVDYINQTLKDVGLSESGS